MRQKIIFGLLLLVVAGLAVWTNNWFHTRGTISIQNHSEQTLENVYLTYHCDAPNSQMILIGKLSPNSRYRHQINYANIHESDICISYQIGQNPAQTLTAAGYVANYNKEHYIVHIPEK